MADPVRVVSLIASATEIVCALGRGEDLVGRSHECDHPPRVRDRPVCSEPRVDPARPSAVIDRDVRERVARALSIYRVDPDRIRDLDPDVILTQDQCEVCAVSPRDVEEALGELCPGSPRVVSLHPGDLGDVWDDVRSVARALGDPAAGEELVRGLEARIRGAEEETAGLERPTVACLDWLDPPMVAGHWMPELVRKAGGEPLLAEDGAPAPRVEWADLAEADPEVLVCVPCGFDLERTLEEMPAIAARDGWEGLRAVREGRVAVADGNAYFNRPGPRLVESTEILAEVLHPDEVSPGHRGTGWVPWSGPSGRG